MRTNIFFNPRLWTSIFKLKKLTIKSLTTLIIIGSFFIFSNVMANTAHTGMRNITSMQIVADMGAGWNLGNTLDTEMLDETGWGNPLTTKAMIDEISKKGFKTLRLPVTWRFHIGNAPDYTIEPEWLDRVEEIANYAFENDMYVIINIHHDDPWIIPTYEKLDEVKEKLDKLWTQIANRFKDYGDYLIFETLNEPRYEGAPEEWQGGTAESRDCVNQYHKASVDAIRATGGNNTLRHLMISTYAASTGSEAINELIIPNNDKNSIVSLHSYYPYKFCLTDEDITWGTDNDKKELTAELDKIYNKFVANGRAVVMGEWCGTNNNNQPDRLAHAKYYAHGCAERGICPVWWDNGNVNNSGLFDRNNLTWAFPEIANAIINETKNTSTFGNPIIKHLRTADPSAQVWDDGKVWIYASHDMDWATDYSSMDGYHAFSSYDMVNWTDHGEILHSRDVDWGLPAGGFMFAPDAAYKNGTYYLYFPHLSNEWGWRVGVATSNKPEGPFTDVGHYIDGTDNIDPTCFIDDDGQAYLIWGGDSKPPKIAKLKENMVELAEEPRIIEYGSDNFGEGPFMHKRDGIYYFSYTEHVNPNIQAFYAMSDSPYGPFDFKGGLNKTPPGSQDHHSMIEYHGQWYYFYHVGNYGDKASMFRRTVCIDSLFYNEDGTMQQIVQTTKGVGHDLIGMTPGIIVPGRVEAENNFRQNGIEVLQINDTESVITSVNDNDWFDFVLEILGSEEYKAEIKVTNPVAGSKIYLSVDEQIIDTIIVDAEVETLETSIFLHHGKHTLKFLFSNPETAANLMNIDCIDLYGDTKYYKIDASVTTGGSITPEGTMYVAQGDSSRFSFDWVANFRPDNIMIDGIKQNSSNSYTFRNISENHTIEAQFAECNRTVLTPYIKVGNKNYTNTAEISLYEGDTLTLKVEYEDEGILLWSDPYNKINTENELEIIRIKKLQEGYYTTMFTNDQGCKSNLSFNIKVKYLELDVYEAENWQKQSGIQTESCSDITGGNNIGFIENNDWSTYNINIKETGIYNFTARLASANSGGKIELSIDDNILATLPIDGSSTNGWQDWYTTDAVEAEFEKGNHVVKLTYKGGGGYLFNMNWFDLEFNRPVSIDALDKPDALSKLLFCYPNDTGYNINYTLKKSARVNLSIVNVAGVKVKTLLSSQNQSAGSYNLTWNADEATGKIVPNGVYLIVLTVNNKREVQKIVISN